MDLPLEMTAPASADTGIIHNEGYGVPPSDPMSVDQPLSPNPADPALNLNNHDASSTGAPSVTGSTTNRPIEPSSLFVGRLHAEVRASDLEVLFSKYGRIKRCELKRGGYAFVEFDESDAAREALKEDGTKMHGEAIAVMFAKGS
ncbi:hypothetical protein BCR44DRAFT_1413336 [Catenaria anguillulae PL171]|uniref:RRM domain-containing protein n=1 Tax=Catenaria anguillulae PL171 TaxID=765915 RepID=A0A1Y2HU40_9FUNG|nr:hypothetical protein BCR44DRAFT_1413336 [Catenaria anguillulae PL171]